MWSSPVGAYLVFDDLLADCFFIGNLKGVFCILDQILIFSRHLCDSFFLQGINFLIAAGFVIGFPQDIRQRTFETLIHLDLELFFNLKGSIFSFRFTQLLRHLFLKIDHRLQGIEAEFKGFDHNVFTDFLRAGFDHQNGFPCGCHA